MDKNMKQYLDKAEVLIEALPYIQKFNRKVIVVKYGGSAMVDENLKKRVIEDVTLLKLVGFKPIIVHGGGKEISRWVGKVGMEPKFINGRRVTDEPTMELAEMVLGKVNKELVQMVESLGVRAIGLSGKDGGLLNVTKKYSNGEDIGYLRRRHPAMLRHFGSNQRNHRKPAEAGKSDLQKADEQINEYHASSLPSVHKSPR